MSLGLLELRKAGTVPITAYDPVTGDTFQTQVFISYGSAELPRITPNEPYPTSFSNTTTVGPAGRDYTDLQAALNFVAAHVGNTNWEIVLDAGVTWTGNYTLPARSGTGWIVIRSSALSSLPEGTRVDPTMAANMPKILSPNSGAALQTVPGSAGASYYRLSGLELGPTSTVTTIYWILGLGDGDVTQNDFSLIPSHLVVDRCWIHGNSHDLGSSHGISLQCGYSVIVDTYIDQIHATSGDCQAVACWNGTGPFRLKNSYFEASVENVIFGGSDPHIIGLVPADLTIDNCHFYTPPAWRGVWQKKNVLEFKNMKRALVKNCVFDNCWYDAQDGTAILVTPVNQSGTAPWCTVQDITYDTLHIRNVTNAFGLASDPGRNEHGPAIRGARVSIKNILVEKLGGHGDYGNPDGSSGRGILLGGLQGVTVQHMTALGASNIVLSDSLYTTDNFICRDNILGDEAFIGDNVGSGVAALNTFAPGYVLDHNVLMNGSGGLYSGIDASNMITSTEPALNADYSLAAGSPYAGKASDGTDPGANVAAILSATNGAVQHHG